MKFTSEERFLETFNYKKYFASDSGEIKIIILDPALLDPHVEEDE